MISGKVPILIAEDDADDRFLLKEVLKRFGDVLDFYFVEDGEELMEFLTRRGGYCSPAFPQPRLILLDLRMPRKNGREALVQIKEEDKLKRIPVVVWTDCDMENEKRFCLDAGAEGYVTKPCKFADLEAAVKDILKNWLALPSSVNPACALIEAYGIQPSESRYLLSH